VEPPSQNIKRINLLTAWLIPGVALYSSLYFILKLTVYSMLLWLQLYLKEELSYSVQMGANISTVLDIGAMIGSTSMGYISDKLYGKRAPVAFVAVVFANIVIYNIAFFNKDMTTFVFYVSMFLFGYFISGLNNLV
jgi:sugar phosphate permease